MDQFAGTIAMTRSGPEPPAIFIGRAERRAIIEQALHLLQLSVTLRAALVLLGDIPDLVSIAQALHRRTLGPDRSFVVCDRRRFEMGADLFGRTKPISFRALGSASIRARTSWSATTARRSATCIVIETS